MFVPSADHLLPLPMFTFFHQTPRLQLLIIVWRRICSPGDPIPQRQCARLLSTYLKEGEGQKEVLEAKDDEEKESEVDGEVGERERVTQHVHETWR